MRVNIILLFMAVAALSSCNSFKLDKQELQNLKLIGNADHFEIHQETGLFILQIQNAKKRDDQRALASLGYAIEFYKIVYGQITSIDTRTTFRISYSDSGQTETFDFKLKDLALLNSHKNRIEELFKNIGADNEINSDIFYKSDCHDFEKEIIESNQDWRPEENELLLFRGVLETTMDLCEQKVEGFQFSYYHLQFNLILFVYITSDGEVVSILSQKTAS